MVDTTKLVAGAGAAGLLAFALSGRGSADTPPDENEQPYADFDVNNDGLTIAADASGSNDPADGQLVAYEWRLSTGNGISVTTGAGETFSYTVSSEGAGTYTLELVVTDDAGATDTASKTFDVVAPNQGPLAQFEVTTNGLSISADGSLSDDPDGQIVDYEWALYRRADNADVGFPIQVGESYSQTVNSEGTYELRLAVTDDSGETATASQTFEVEEPNVPPEVSFTTSTDGLVLSANAQAAVDPDGSIVAYDWTLLDGAGGQVVTGKSPQFSYTVPSGGEYTLELVVTDNEGLTAADSQSVDVVAPNEAPVAQFNSDTDGLTITADAGNAYDPDGEIVAYDWALQTSGQNIETIADQTGQNFSTTVPSGGYYTLTLQVTDDRGAQRTVNEGLNVVEPNTSPTANFALSADGLEITADGTGSADPDGSIVSYEWRLSTSGGIGVTTGAGESFSYSVSSEGAGTYTLELTVTDDRGASDTRSKTVTAEKPAPSLTITDVYADGSSVVVESDIDNASEMDLMIYGGTQTSEGSVSYDVIEETGWIPAQESYSANYYNSYDEIAVDFYVRNDEGEEEYQFERGDFSDGGGGNGGDNGDSGTATAEINRYIDAINDEVVADGTDSSADGSYITSYDWRLYAYPGSSDETVAQTVSGPEPRIPLYYNADYRLELAVTAADGSEDTTETTFSYSDVGYENELYIKNDANPTIAKQTVLLTFESSVSAEVSGGSATNESGENEPRRVETELGPTDDIRIDYGGDISTFDWRGGCIRVEDGSGERMDPFDMTTGGQRNRWLGGSDEVFEVTIYQTEELWDLNGQTSPRVLADWLAGALRKRDVSYDILYDLPVIRVPSESTRCYNPYWYQDDVCEPGDPCDPDDKLPSALYWWDNARTGGTLHKQHNEETGDNVNAPLGSTYVQRKDSNILLTAAGGGGCGFSTSRLPQCVGPGKHIDRGIRFDSTGFSVGLDTDFVSNIHDCLHEIGHNLEFKHPPEDGCDLGGGEGWIDDDGRWHRTPCIADVGCENYCGTYVEDPDSPERDNSLNAYKHPVYTECTIDYFMQEMGPEQGSIQPIAQTTTAGDETPSNDCGLGEVNGSTIAREAERPAENDNFWG